MPVPLQITFRHMESSPAVEAAIRKRAEKLERFSDRIVGCRVVVEAPHRHQRKGKLYAIRIDLVLPGGEVPVTRAGPENHAHEDIYVAIRDAFDAARRMVEDHTRQLEGAVKRHDEPMRGSVLRLFPHEGYGFIATSDNREIYFHRDSVTNGGFDKLEPGAAVRLVVAHGESAQGPQASTVTAIGKPRITD